MAHITFNEQQLTQELNGNIPVGEVMDFILQNCAEKESVITEIALNGRSISAEEEEQLLQTPIQSYDKIHFTVKRTLDLAFEAIQSSPSYIDSLIWRTQDLADLYRCEEYEKGALSFMELIDTLQLFLQLTSNAYQVIRDKLGENRVKGPDLEKLQRQLLTILQKILPAQEIRDYVLLTDLLEYELIPHLKEWSCLVISPLNELKSGETFSS